LSEVFMSMSGKRELVEQIVWLHGKDTQGEPFE
jgi:hypothetical protein